MTDKTGLVVAPQSEAAYEGASVLAAGGNAADALVTAALVQGVTDPHRCGIGGFGCATLYWAKRRESLAVSFLGRAGRRCREDQWADILEQPAPDGFGFIVAGKVNDVGYDAITTPGTLAGLDEIHRRFRIRFRCRGRYLDEPPPRARADGAARADDIQVRDPRGRPDQDVRISERLSVAGGERGNDSSDRNTKRSPGPRPSTPPKPSP